MLPKQSNYRYRNPQEQLHQISEETDQLTMIEQMNKNIKKQRLLGINSPKYKIVNAKGVAAFNEGNQQFTSWINMSNSEFKPRTMSIDKIQLSKRKITENSGNESNLFQSFARRQKNIQEKFLSMAELCHRYTFINNSTCDRNCKSQLGLNQSKNDFELRHAKHVEIKLDEQTDFLVPRNKLQAKRRKNSNQIIKLPQVLKHQKSSIGQPSGALNPPAIYMDKVLKIISKSVQKKRYQSKQMSNLNQSLLQKQRTKANEIGKLVQQINWKRSQQKIMQDLLTQQFQASHRKVSKKRSKFLGQCLVLNKI